jgi:hypothetical protein
MFVVPVSHSSPAVSTHRRPPAARREGLTSLRGFPFPVLSSELATAAATRIALRAQDASDLLRSVLGVTPRLSLRVLDRRNWAAHAEVAAYGVTHVATNGDLIVGATPPDAWHGVSRYLARRLSAHELARLVDVHGVDSTHSRGPALDALAESLIIHDVAHVLADQHGLEVPSRWLEEAFANYVLVAVLGTNDPQGLRLLGSLAEAARSLDDGLPTLADFERGTSRTDVASSVLAELAITRAVYAAYASRDTAPLVDLFESVRTSDADADFELGRMAALPLYPSLAAIPSLFPATHVGLAA